LLLMVGPRGKRKRKSAFPFWLKAFIPL
jgi:hypothetical protein